VTSLKKIKNGDKRLGIVVYAYNPNYLGGEGGKIGIQAGNLT
jgi:hypothetical protein